MGSGFRTGAGALASSKAEARSRPRDTTKANNGR
jgi:hypothetical protein